MAFNLTRMTVYALISALEEDLRSITKDLVQQDSTSIIFADELKERAKLRLEKDLGFTFEDVSLYDLIDYLDLGDTFQVINSNYSCLPPHISKIIKKNSRTLEKIIPVRNRVMHIRPLDVEDYPNTSSYCYSLVKEDPAIWSNLKSTLEHIEKNPSYVLSLDIKNLDDGYSNHNLPLPDFDETGLIGRSEDVDRIKQLCYGPFPVISIVGEGGVGKTALALKVAYELLEDPKKPFDAIVWVSSKTTQITVNEIKDIKDAITDSIGVIHEISKQLTGDAASTEGFKEITEYLSTFRIALFIDNLETILDDNIRAFVGSLPSGSKIIITSRIGIGAFEYPVKLQGIDESYASQLLRILAKIRNVDSLKKLDEKTMRNYVNRMYRNPSYIKWFVSSVQTGLSPELVLQNSGMFLEFCMSNVYGYLTEQAQLVTSAMQCAPGLKDIPELSYLTGFDSLTVHKVLQELMSTNMLSQASKTKGASVKTTYQLSELARSYLSKHHKPSRTYQKSIQDKRNQLNALYEKQLKQRTGDKYNTLNIQFRDKNDRVIVKMLQDAQVFVRSGQHDKAYVLLEEAHKLAPDYFEVARVLAYFHQQNGNYNDTREQYDLAIVLAPNLPQLHYWYGKFLLHHEQNVDDAVSEFEEAYRLDKESVEVALSLSRGYMFQHNFTNANRILTEIESILDSSTDDNKRTFFDTKIQLLYRKADDFSQRGEISSALEKLEGMKTTFDNLPEEFKDDYSRKKLTKCHFTLKNIYKTNDNELLKRAEIVSSWLTHEGR